MVVASPGHASDPIVAYDHFGDNRSPQRGARLDNPLHNADAQAEPFIVTLTVEDIDSSSSAPPRWWLSMWCHNWVELKP